MWQSGCIAGPDRNIGPPASCQLSGPAGPAGLESALLLGGAKSKERQQVLDRLASGEIQIIIGTHALLSEAVQFADLGLAVIDEQHRFGVRQRLLLSEKGRGCDILVMTATPIPRSLAMTAYGDLKASQLDEKPPGRQEVETALVNLERMEAIIGRLRVALEAGQRAYWICPLVEETDKSDIAAAENRHRLLTKILPEAKPALVHGRMLSEARQTEMEKFRSGEASLLVATTVIEVGVDVPEASIIIIEHAERFGLAQLHQLRGRVGRGAARSSCLLLWQKPLSETASARLKIMRASNDGFVIAEEDLKLRGPGEVLGHRQSGIPEFQLADLATHADLLARARQEAETVLHRWPDLAAAEAACYRMLLSLFEKDRAVRYLGAGWAFFAARFPVAFFGAFLAVAFLAVAFFGAFLAAFLAGRPAAAALGLFLGAAFGAGGVTIPPETTSLSASSTLISRKTSSCLGQNSKNPEVGFGVVGTNTLTVSSRVRCCTSPLVLPVTKPITHNPLRGYCTSTTSRKASDWLAITVSRTCLEAE